MIKPLMKALKSGLCFASFQLGNYGNKCGKANPDFQDWPDFSCMFETLTPCESTVCDIHVCVGVREWWYHPLLS
jgi:hypothetical protein